MTETYYDLLDVDEDADTDEIREAYREKLHEYHPDVSDHPDAKERFLKVKEANAVLSDPEEREKYDSLGHAAYVDSNSQRHPESDDQEQDDQRTSDADATADQESAGSWSGNRRDSGSRRNRQSNASTRSGGSAAAEYRNRRRRAQSRSRSDRRSGGSRSDGRSRSRTDSSRARTTGTRTDSEAADADRGRTETDQDQSSATASDEEAGSTSEDEGPTDTTTRSFGQPAEHGMFVSPDIEMLRFPAIAVYYFLGFELGLSLLLAPLFVPLYLYYRRHKFTERLLTDDIITEGETETATTRVVMGGTAATVLTLVFGAVTVSGYLPFDPTDPVLLVLGIGIFVGLAVSLYSFAELLLVEWFEASGTDQPVAWDVLARAPVLIVPLVVGQPSAFPSPGALVTLLFGVSALAPIAYFAKAESETGVDIVDRVFA